jgi:hypothetical protein
MNASEDFWQGYACAMEEIEHRLKYIPEAEDVLDYAREEIAAADKKIEQMKEVNR